MDLILTVAADHELPGAPGVLAVEDTQRLLRSEGPGERRGAVADRR